MYEEELIKNRKAIESSLKIDNNLKDIIDRFAEKQNLKGARFQGEVLLSLVGQTLHDHLGKAVHDLLRQASCNLSNQNYEEAKKSLDNAFDLNPNTAEVCFYMGYTLYDFGNFDAAITFADKARELNSFCTRNCHELKGLSLIKLKNYECAILEFYETLKFDSAHYFTLGLCFSYLERYAEAIKYIEKTNGHFEFRGMLYQHLGNYSKSLESLNVAINSGLASAKIHYGKGVSLEYLATNCTGDERLQHYSQALNCFKKDIELNGANILALTHQAHILKILGREEAALESLNEAYKISQASEISSFNFSPKSLAFVKIMFAVREQMLARSQDANTKLLEDEAGHSEPGMKSTPERELEKDPATLTAQITAQMPTYEITESNNLQSLLDLSLISAENTGDSGEKVPSAQTIIEEEDKMSKASIEGKQNYNIVTSIVDALPVNIEQEQALNTLKEEFSKEEYEAFEAEINAFRRGGPRLMREVKEYHEEFVRLSADITRENRWEKTKDVLKLQELSLDVELDSFNMLSKGKNSEKYTKFGKYLLYRINALKECEFIKPYCDYFVRFNELLGKEIRYDELPKDLLELYHNLPLIKEFHETLGIRNFLGFDQLDIISSQNNLGFHASVILLECNKFLHNFRLYSELYDLFQAESLNDLRDRINTIVGEYNTAFQRDAKHLNIKTYMQNKIANGDKELIYVYDSLFHGLEGVSNENVLEYNQLFLVQTIPELKIDGEVYDS